MYLCVLMCTCMYMNIKYNYVYMYKYVHIYYTYILAQTAVQSTRWRSVQVCMCNIDCTAVCAVYSHDGCRRRRQGEWNRSGSCSLLLHVCSFCRAPALSLARMARLMIQCNVYLYTHSKIYKHVHAHTHTHFKTPDATWLIHSCDMARRNTIG